MRALFVTSETSDVDSLVRAWDCWQPNKSTRVKFPHMGEPRDEEILAVAREMLPDIIFYIGANEGSGIPTVKTFLALRDLAPLINLCCDAADWPWHEPLNHYKEAGCFDLQVALDGNHDAPVDLVTVTPVDPAPYSQSMPRAIRCGFSGGVSPENQSVFKTSFSRYPPRSLTKARPANALPAWSPSHKKRVSVPSMSRVIRDQVVWNTKGLIVVRERKSTAPYSEHVAFLLSCQMVVNVSISGSGDAHQIKGRVLEAGWAGCALLETEGSPIATWMPQGSYFIYHDADHAQSLIESLTDEQITKSAVILSQYVRSHYHPRQIYGEILKRAGLVDNTVAIPTA